MTPRKQDQKFNKQYAHELLKIAEGDLLSAKSLRKTMEGRKENICFIAQQSIEKSLKAVLVWCEIPVPLVHDAGILVAKMPPGKLPPSGYDLSVLNAYATIWRYEEGQAELTNDDLDTILDSATKVLSWAKTEIAT